MTALEIADLLADYRRAKAEVQEIRIEMMKLAVEQFGMDQAEANKTSLETFFDGYLTGFGMTRGHRQAA